MRCVIEMKVHVVEMDQVNAEVAECFVYAVLTGGGRPGTDFAGDVATVSVDGDENSSGLRDNDRVVTGACNADVQCRKNLLGTTDGVRAHWSVRISDIQNCQRHGAFCTSLQKSFPVIPKENCS